MLNATYIQQLTPDQFVLYSHQMAAIPALVIFFILSSLVVLITGLLLSNNKEKIFKIWIFQVIFTLVILIILILLPTTISSITHFILLLF